MSDPKENEVAPPTNLPAIEEQTADPDAVLEEEAAEDDLEEEDVEEEEEEEDDEEDLEEEDPPEGEAA